MFKDYNEDGKYFIKDAVVSNREQDEFRHIDIAQNIRNIIHMNKAPLNIAIIGDWGSGKSSVIELLKQLLDGKDYRFCEVNAWKYEKEAIRKSFLKNIYLELDGKKPSRWADLIDALRNYRRESANEKLSFFDKVKSFVSTFLRVLLQTMGYSFVFYILIKIFGASIKEFNTTGNFEAEVLFPLLFGIGITIIQSFNNIFQGQTYVRVIPPLETTDEYEELFEKRKKELMKKNPNLKIVVIVDDLDRLCPQKMVEALDAIKAFEGCIFIVPFDEQILKSALTDKKVSLSNNEHLTITSELFLEKMFQFKIPMHPIIDIDIRRYAIAILKEQTPDLINIVGTDSIEDILDIIVHSAVTNPRKLKKIINIFANNLLLIKRREENEKLNQGVLSDIEGIRLVAKMSVLQADYFEFYKELSNDYSYIERFLKCANRVIAIYENDTSENLTIDENTFPLEDIYESNLSHYFTFKHDSKNMLKADLKSEYIDLYNFLNSTNDIALERISNFIYMSQSTDSYLVGDKTTREIIDAIISNSSVKLKSELVRDKENLKTLENLIANSFNSNIVKSKIVNALYCVVNSISEDNTKEFLMDISKWLGKNIGSKKINVTRFETQNLCIGIKKTSHIGFISTLSALITKIRTNEAEFVASNGKLLNELEVSGYILSLFNNMWAIRDDLSSDLIEEIKSLSELIVKNKIEYINYKDFIDKFVLEHGRHNCVFIDKRVLADTILDLVKETKKGDTLYFDTYKELLSFSSINNEIFVSKSLLDLVTNEIIDEEIAGEILKYSSLVDEGYADQFIEAIYNQDIYKDEDLFSVIDRMMRELKWSCDVAELVDEMINYYMDETDNSLFEAIQVILKKGYLNKLEKVCTTLISGLIQVNTYYPLLPVLIEAFDEDNRNKLFTMLVGYIRKPSSVDEDIFNKVVQICSEIYKSRTTHEKMNELISSGLPLIKGNMASYPIWTRMIIKVSEIYMEPMEEVGRESLVEAIAPLTITDEFTMQSVLVILNHLLPKIQEESKGKIGEFVLKNYNLTSHFILGITLIQKLIEYGYELELEQFILEGIGYKPEAVMQMIIDKNIVINKDTLIKIIDAALINNTKYPQLVSLAATILREMCEQDSDKAYEVIEILISRENSSTLDRLIQTAFSKPTEKAYSIFKKVLYSSEERNTLQVYNLLNYAKPFEDVFSTQVRADLICKAIKRTQSSYEHVLNRIESMYKPILKNMNIKNSIGNELALLFKRIPDGDKGRQAVVKFATENGLVSAIKRNSRDYGIFDSLGEMIKNIKKK